jgi:hypothetical protein
MKVVAGGSPGRLWYLAECPRVICHEGYYYLSRTSDYRGKLLTTAYRSLDPTDFGIDDDSKTLTTLPEAEPGIIQRDDKYRVAALNPNLDGIRVTTREFVAG